MSGGAKLISSAGLAGAVYPSTLAAHNGYVSTSGIHGAGAAVGGGLLHSGIVSSPGYYGAGSKLIAGNGLYAGHGIYSAGHSGLHAGLHANGLLASTSGLRFVRISSIRQCTRIRSIISISAPNAHCRYAHGVVPTVSKLVTAPIAHVKAAPVTTAVKSVYSQHDEYYVSVIHLNAML